MPYAFKLPTTSSLAFQDFLSSESHPSLPFTSTTSRGLLRNALKRHKRLPLHSQSAHLTTILSSLHAHIPNLLALDAGLSGATIDGEEIQVTLIREVQVAWRAQHTATIPGRQAQRITLPSFEYEVLFSLLTLGETYYLLARAQLHTLYDATTPTPSQRTSAISIAMKHFLDAHAVFNCAHIRASGLSRQQEPTVDISASTLGALASLALAEATLIAVLKDDPYPAAVAQDRNKNDKDWMITAPSIPKVRAHLFARLCLAAAEHAARGLAMLDSSSGRVSEGLSKYFDDVKCTARGKACRFFGIDAEVGGQTGVGIAWCNCGRREMGFAKVGEVDTGGRLGRFKKEWMERREDRKVEKGGDWGGDGGRFEEARVVDMLAAKWMKMNDTVNVQVVPPSEPLLATMPSGREYHSPKPWILPKLDSMTLARMRAPPDPETEKYRPAADDSDDGEEDAGDPVGAFPGTGSEYVKIGGTPY